MSNIQFPFKVNITYIINKQNQVLLQKKSRGWGKGNWNGPGGKMESGEDIVGAAKREVYEETSLIIKNPELRAEIEFVFANESKNNYCYVFLVKEFEGKPHDKGEGELAWFDIDNVPYEKMWDDDKYWLEKVLKGEKLKLRIFFDEFYKVKEIINLK